MRPSPPVLAAAALAGLCVAASPAAAQYGGQSSPLSSGLGGGYSGGLQSTLGTSTRVGDLRPQLEAYYARNARAPSITAPAWLIQPSISVDTGITDNAQRASSARRADIYTVITPSITVSRDAPRLKLDATYAPSYTKYLNTKAQSGLAQTGNLRALAILVPDALFFDARASASQSSITGNSIASQNSTANYNRQNQVQTYTFSLGPYAQHRFGSWGVGRIGYSLQRTLQDVPSDQQGLSTVTQTGTAGSGTTGNLTTHSENAVFTSGENLGRFNTTTTLSATQYRGSNAYRGAHRNEAQNQVGFAFTRTITLLGGFGYQDVAYNGTPAYRLREPTWNTGVRYAPNPDSIITVLYGRRDASNSISFDGQFAPTARTRISGRYSTGVTSDLQEAQSLLESTSVGTSGGLSDSTTGAPVSSSGLSGTQNGIYRVRRLSLTASLLQQRNTYSVTISSEDRTTLTTSTSLLNNGTIPAGTSTSSVSASAAWQHDLTPDISTSLTAQYGTTNSTSQLVTGSGGKQRTLSMSAVLSKTFTQTLTGSLRYSFTDQSGGTGTNTTVYNPLTGRTFNTGAYTENVFLVGLRKSF